MKGNIITFEGLYWLSYCGDWDLNNYHENINGSSYDHGEYITTGTINDESVYVDHPKMNFMNTRNNWQKLKNGT